jgi:hypothetical protein
MSRELVESRAITIVPPHQQFSDGSQPVSTSEISSIDGLPTTFQRCAILQEGLEVSASANAR